MNGDDPVVKSDALDEQIGAFPIHSVFSRRQVVIGFIVIMVTVLVTFTIVFIRLGEIVHSGADETQSQNACRFAASTEVNTISDALAAKEAELFVVAVANPRDPGEPQDPRIIELGGEMDELVQLLGPALVAREDAVRECGG